MRKLSLLSTMLVVGLVIGLVGFNALAASDTDTVGLSRSNGNLSLTVNSSAVTDGNFKDFDPTSDTDIGTTELKVVSGGQDWELYVASGYPSVTTHPTNAAPGEIESHFKISPDVSGSDAELITVSEGRDKPSGSNGRYSVNYDYTWDTFTTEDAAQYMPNGDYKIEIQYTVTSTS